MYRIRYWSNQEIYRSFEKLGVAKRWCRGLGHTGENSPFLMGYPPIAFVSNDAGECVYNPRFGKNISSGVAGLINAQPSSHF